MPETARIPETEIQSHPLIERKSISAKSTAGTTLPPIYDERQPTMECELFTDDTTDLPPLTIRGGDVINFDEGGRDETLLIVQITDYNAIGYDIDGTGYQSYTPEQLETLIEHNLTDMVDGTPAVYPDPLDYGSQ